MYEEKYEYEEKLLINDINTFSNILNWDAAEFGGWKTNFKVIRPTIFMDTQNFDLLKKQYSLSIVINSDLGGSKENKIVLKSPSQIKKSIRKEFIYRVNEKKPLDFDINKNYKFSNIPFIKKNLNSSIINSLRPQVLIKQTRNKRHIMINDKPLYLSFDSVEYLNFSNLDVIDNIFVLELESSESNLDDMLNYDKVKPILDYIKFNFNAYEPSYSKYEYGVNLLRKI